MCRTVAWAPIPPTPSLFPAATGPWRPVVQGLQREPQCPRPGCGVDSGRGSGCSAPWFLSFLETNLVLWSSPCGYELLSSLPKNNFLGTLTCPSIPRVRRALAFPEPVISQVMDKQAHRSSGRGLRVGRAWPGRCGLTGSVAADRCARVSVTLTGV